MMLTMEGELTMADVMRDYGMRDKEETEDFLRKIERDELFVWSGGMERTGAGFKKSEFDMALSP